MSTRTAEQIVQEAFALKPASGEMSLYAIARYQALQEEFAALTGGDVLPLMSHDFIGDPISTFTRQEDQPERMLTTDSHGDPNDLEATHLAHTDQSF